MFFLARVAEIVSLACGTRGAIPPAIFAGHDCWPARCGALSPYGEDWAAGAGPSERHVTRFLQALANATRPLVAAVQGRAVVATALGDGRQVIHGYRR